MICDRLSEKRMPPVVRMKPVAEIFGNAHDRRVPAAHFVQIEHLPPLPQSAVFHGRRIVRKRMLPFGRRIFPVPAKGRERDFHRRGKSFVQPLKQDVAGAAEGFLSFVFPPSEGSVPVPVIVGPAEDNDDVRIPIERIDAREEIMIVSGRRGRRSSFVRCPIPAADRFRSTFHPKRPARSPSPWRPSRAQRLVPKAPSYCARRG